MISDALLAQIFQVNCGLKGGKNTGTFHCPFNVNRVSTLILTPAGFEFAEAISLAYIQTLQQQGNAVVLSKAVAVEPRTAQDNITTEAGSNIKTVSGKSPREFGFKFKNGLYNDMAMRTLEGFGGWDVTYLDEKLSIIFTSTPTTVKGITLGSIGVEPYMQGNGAEDAYTILWLQELYRSEFDQDATWITAKNHDIRLASLDGVNDVEVEIATADIPSDGDTTVVFSVKGNADKKAITGFTSLLLADLEFTKNGAVVAFTGAPTYSATTGKFTGTLATALAEDDVLGLRLNNTAFTTGIIKKGNRLFISNTEAVTVTA